MRIPTREEQARYTGVNAHDTQRFNVQERTPNMQLQVNADMFGGGQARAIGQSAQELQKGARQIAHWYRENELTKATETFTKYKESLNDELYGENGIFTSKGESALEAPKRANELLKKRAAEFSRQAGSSLGQDFFMQQASGFNQQLMPRATMHAETERKNWMYATHSAAASNSINEAVKNYSNPDVFNQLMGEAAMNTALAAKMQGLPPEAVKLKRDEAVSSGYMQVGQSLLAAGDVSGAMGILKSGRLVGQDGMRFQASIRQEEKRMQAEARANAAEARIGIMVSETDTMFEQFGGDLAAAYGYIRGKYGNDPKTRLDLEAAISRRVGMEEAAENKTRRIQTEQYQNAALDAIGAEDATPAKASKILLEAPDEIKPEISRAIGMRFPSQEVVVSDAEKLAEAKDGIFTGKYKDEKEFKRLFMPYISSNEMEKFTNDIRKNKDKASDSSLRASFNSMLREYDIESLANAADKKPGEFVRDAWNNFVSEAYEKDFSTAQEKRQHMQEYLRRVSLSKPGFWFGNKWPNTEEGPSFVLRPLRDEGYSEVEPPRPQSLPEKAKWDAEREGWVYGNKIVRASRVVTK